jgi:hypothetical protein
MITGLNKGLGPEWAGRSTERKNIFHHLQDLGLRGGIEKLRWGDLLLSASDYGIYIIDAADSLREFENARFIIRTALFIVRTLINIVALILL